ncbi:endonuclease/exonuclease/phosphatase family protein [Halobium palmae]|uniref:Endonuclease/exonuclease/phosphatase family protein n=1 Tax=Halobium palmae TaxID=1776492 RepID=A0ABD5RWZ7_9EURY
MPTITDDPPVDIQSDLTELHAALDENVPSRKIDRNLLIGTWNLCNFGSLTDEWVAGADASPKRDLHSLRAIADVVRRFDVVAIQEVTGDLRAIRHMMRYLGDDWGLAMTDVTRGSDQGYERLAFVFDRRTTQPSGLVGEIVVPDEQLADPSHDGIAPHALTRQFARTPYAVSFRTGSETFVLVTLHVRYGAVDDRTPELREIAEWLDDWAKQVHSWDHNLIALGDFNIDRMGDPRYEAFVSTGLRTPEELHSVPRTIYADVDDPAAKFYDQIAWFTEGDSRPALSLDFRRAGSFDFRRVALPRRELTMRQLAHRISDHYPLWAEFELSPF